MSLLSRARYRGLPKAPTRAERRKCQKDHRHIYASRAAEPASLGSIGDPCAMTAGDEARAASLFAQAGVPASGRLVRVATGWSNEVWMTESHVLRVASRRGPGSLQHELAVASQLPPTVPYPQPVASGWHEDVLWAVAPRVPGRPLSVAWAEADPADEPVLLDSLAASMRALHAVDLSAELGRSAPWTDGRPPAGGPPVEVLAMPDFIAAFVADAITAGAMPRETADMALSALEGATGALSPAPAATIHADLGFDNAIWDGEQIWLIDLEWCCSAPADYELVHILRYCAHPENLVDVDVDVRDRVTAKDHTDVPRRLARAYPALFSNPRLRDRVLVYGLAGFARGWHWRPDLWRSNVARPEHPSRELLAFLDGGHWISLLT